MTEKEKKSNPLATAFAATESGESSGTDYEQDVKAESLPDLTEIANTDIGDLSAIRKDAAVIMSRTQDYLVKDADDVKTLLRAFDNLITADDTLDEVTLFSARDYVQRLMVTLKEYPEFSSILVDSDMKNILTWAWAMYDKAQESLAMANDKATRPKATKAPKTAAAKHKKAQQDALADAMGSLFGGES